MQPRIVIVKEQCQNSKSTSERKKKTKTSLFHLFAVPIIELLHMYIHSLHFNKLKDILTHLKCLAMYIEGTHCLLN